MEICIKEFIKKVNLMAWDNIIGIQEAILRVISQMDLEMDMDYGKEDLEIVISTKDIIKMIKKMDREFFHGQMVMFIKEIIKMI